jgi:hypothetical protein
LKSPGEPQCFRQSFALRAAVSIAAVLIVFWSRARRLYVSASPVACFEVIAVRKLTNELNRIRLELKYRNGE